MLYSAINMSAIKGKVIKLAKADHVVSGVRKNSRVEVSVITAKNRVQATVT